MPGTASRPWLAKTRLIRAGYAAVLLIPLTACCARVKPDQPTAEPQAVATPQPAADTAAPPPSQPAPTAAAAAAAAASTPKPQTAAEPADAAAPQRQAARPPAPAVEPPTPQTGAKPAGAAPSASKPAAAPSAGARVPQVPTKPVAPVPSEPKPVAPAPPSPKSPAPETAEVPAAKAPPTVAPLDLNRLKQGLKDTKAIGLFSKITLKNQMDDLLDWFREYHRGLGKRSRTDLRRSYDLLVIKVLSLVQDHDQRLASDIVSSREAMWALLVDPKKFAELQV